MTIAKRMAWLVLPALFLSRSAAALQSASVEQSTLDLETTFTRAETEYATAAVRVLSRPGPGVQCFFIHGWMHSADRWRELMSRLPADWDLHSIELPGFGESTIDSARRSTIDRCAAMMENVIAGLRDETRPSVIVAHSLGGLIALRFTHTRFDNEVYSAVPVNHLHGWLAYLSFERVTRCLLRLNAALPERTARRLAWRAARMTVADESYIDELMIADALRADPVAAARSAKEINRFSLSACAWCHRGDPADDNRHVMVIHAELDQVVAREDSERLAAFLGTEVTVIPASGHTVMNEAAGEFAELLIGMVDSERSPVD